MNDEENNIDAQEGSIDPSQGTHKQEEGAQENKEHKEHPADNTMIMGILAYIGPLVIVPLITSRDNHFVKFHTKQGLVVFSIIVIGWLFTMVMPMLFIFINIINLIALVFSIIGIINVVHKKMKELPFIGQFSKYFTI